jgi:hypothetical protein
MIYLHSFVLCVMLLIVFFVTRRSTETSRLSMSMAPKNWRPFVGKHLTEEQWKKHRLSFFEYSTRTGKYKEFRGGTLGWLKREGLPPITAEMAAEMDKRNEKYENELLANGMLDELMDWRKRQMERRAAVEPLRS